VAEAHITDFGSFLIGLAIFGVLSVIVGVMIQVAITIWHN